MEDGTKARSEFGGETSLDGSLQLLRRAHEGDAVALDALLVAYGSVLERWVTARLPQARHEDLDVRALVRDAVQNAGMDAGARRDVELWMALRQALAQRAAAEIGPVAAHSAPRTGTHSTHIEGNRVPAEVQAKFEAALGRLRVEEREAIVTRIEMGCSYEQIAQLLGKPSTGAARMAVCRALLRLAREMTP